MKKFKILAIATIGIAVFSAFKVDKSSRFNPRWGGWVEIEPGYCDLTSLDVGPSGCDISYTGPVCTALGDPTLQAYESSLTCQHKITSYLLKKP